MMRFKITIIALAVLSTSNANAGGMEVTRLPTEIMFKDGNYFLLSYGRFSPNVTDDTYATQGSMYIDRSAMTASFKLDINDKMSIGVANYKSAEIQLDYGNGSVFFANVPSVAGGPFPNPYVDLTIKTTAFLTRYNIANNMSVIGGVNYSEGSGVGNVLISPAGDITAEKDTSIGGVFGLSYENPDIAMRISGVYQTKQTMAHSSYTTYKNEIITLEEDTKSAVPASLTIDFQSGIAKNTLLFGSIHRAFWGDAHISFWSPEGPLGGTNGLGGGTGYVQKTTWTDTTSLLLGIGQKLSDRFAVSTSINYEAPSESEGYSLLSTTDGVRGITLGSKYSYDNITLTVGANYSLLGDKKVDPLGNLPEGNFTNNSVTSFGIKVGYSF